MRVPSFAAVALKSGICPGYLRLCQTLFWVWVLEEEIEFQQFSTPAVLRESNQQTSESNPLMVSISAPTKKRTHLFSHLLLVLLRFSPVRFVAIDSWKTVTRRYHHLYYSPQCGMFFPDSCPNLLWVHAAHDQRKNSPGWASLKFKIKGMLVRQNPETWSPHGHMILTEASQDLQFRLEFHP